jgi:hypothetical protein
MFNRAESEHFEIELVSIAEDVTLTQETMFDEGDEQETTDSTLLFFHVTNVSDEPVTWWYDEHYFVDEEGFQYKHDPAVGGFEEPASEVPQHWYTTVEIQPGAKARCVTALGAFPTDRSLVRIVYNYEDEHFEVEVNAEQLSEPPV